MKKLLFILVPFLLVCSAGGVSALTITNTGIDATVLIETILANESLKDCVLPGAAYNGNDGYYDAGSVHTPTRSGGTFTRVPAATETDPDYTGGVILSNGWVNQDISGPTNDSFSNELNLSGDSGLAADIGEPNIDATKLEFDISTNGGAISFNYIFATEELYYGRYGANDAFGFYVSEIDQNGQYTDVYSYVKTYSDFFNINPALSAFNRTDPPSVLSGETIYDGITNSIAVESSALAAGTYHIKFVIADGSFLGQPDPLADSSVFIEAGSFDFTAGPPPQPPAAEPVPEPATIILLGLGLAGLSGVGRKTLES